MSKHQRSLQVFYSSKGLCETCGKEAKNGEKLCTKCRERHKVIARESYKRQKIYELLNTLFPMIRAQRKERALETMEVIKKRIKALSSCYREHAD